MNDNVLAVGIVIGEDVHDFLIVLFFLFLFLLLLFVLFLFFLLVSMFRCLSENYTILGSVCKGIFFDVKGSLEFF